MKCPNCGYVRARYKVSRKKLWKGRNKGAEARGVEPRTDFSAVCPECGWEGEIRNEQASEVQEL